jgi:hypothetical protein
MVSLDELEFALIYVEGGMLMGAEAYISVETGEVILYSDDDEDSTLPEDIDEEGKYLSIPSKQELGLGKRLALRFTQEYLSADYEVVENIFRKKGAYSRFKDLLHDRNLSEKWYDYENEKGRDALRDWCEGNGIEIAG